MVKLDREGIIQLYRYLSLIITALFYLTGPPEAPFIFKLGVIITVFIAAKVVMNLYIKNKDHPTILKYIVLVETFSITLLLIPTGGLESPFLWYALNPVLMAGSYISSLFCWVNLFIYCISSSLITFQLFNTNNTNFIEMVYQKTDILLVFLLITLVVQLLFRFIKELELQASVLEAQGEELRRSNQKVRQSMERLKELYRIVETFNALDSQDDLTKSFVEYTAKLTDTELAFYWVPSTSKSAESITLNMEVSSEYLFELQNKLRSLWKEERNKEKPQKVSSAENTYFVSEIRSSARNYGLLGFRNNCLEKELSQENVRQLSFLSELCSIVLERLYLEKVGESLLINEEQNRIANEIHDNVSQRLFSISCSLHYLNAKWDEMPNEKLKERIELIRETSNEATQELRSSIYRLSSHKKGERTYFFNSIRSYLKNLADLNNIKVVLQTSGNEEMLTTHQKSVIFRIIHEATGNAIRHGKCARIDLELVISPEAAKLKIIDNGTGFKFGRHSLDKHGLGLSNMHNLVIALGGNFDINSEVRKGTEINILLPIKKLQQAELINQEGA